MGWKTKRCDLSSQSEHVCTSRKAMAQSTGTVGRHYGRRCKIHLLSLRFEFLLRRFLSAHTASDEGQLPKSQNEPYKMEERLTRFFISDRSAEGPARLEQEHESLAG